MLPATVRRRAGVPAVGSLPQEATTVNLFQELEARGLIHQVSAHEVPLAKALEQPQVVYAGFDPSAPSLHVGNLVPLLGLRRFQQAGHTVIALAGGATGLIGDPSGKNEERNLLGRDALAHNLASIKRQLERFLVLDGQRGVMVDNLDWTGELRLLDFLRDVGKHFAVNVMVKKDSVKNRIEREGEGISFTEFSYSLLQANDYLVLARERGCTVQVGGSDQWGNITAGIDLCRRALGRHVYGLTFPLLMNSDGSKFGKTARGAVYLDPAMTSPFAFRQFWFNTPDADVITRLRLFSFLPVDEIAALERKVQEKSAPNEAQRVLARHMTEMVHGADEAERVERAVEVLFSHGSRDDLLKVPAEYLEQAFDGAPVVELERARLAGEGLSLLDLVVHAVYGGGEKRGQAKRDIAQDKSIALNGEKVVDPERRVTGADLLHDRTLVVRKGKKGYVLVRAV
ncbi:MAG: tyrosine--tRNA ligase [Planctomycetota bacterium]|nr:tyrosine--tRNA ligase [Planctomycetota bacterium]